MNGCSYRSIPGLDAIACENACAADAGCMAYSHNVFTRACELKHTLTARRLDAAWVSGAPLTGPLPEPSSRVPSMVGEEESNRTGRLDGEILDEESVAGVEACTSRCESDIECVAVEFEQAGGRCLRFSVLTGSKDAPTAPGGNAAGVETWLKQVP
jgi:hypothetical protein